MAKLAEFDRYIAHATYGKDTAFREGVSELGLLYAMGVAPSLGARVLTDHELKQEFGLPHYEPHRYGAARLRSHLPLARRAGVALASVRLIEAPSTVPRTPFRSDFQEALDA